MKNKDYKKQFWFGIILVGLGVTFTNTANKSLGIAFLAIGGLLMMLGMKNKNKKD